VIHIFVPSIPISMNAAYANQRGGKGRVLTGKGKRYKLETTSYIARHYPKELKFFKPNVPYALLVHFVFADEVTLLNKGYPEKARTRYKKLDVGNRLKLFEDALTDATGCDDSQNWMIALSKTCGKSDQTHLWVWNMEDEPYNPLVNIRDTLLATGEMQQD
jgi:Holliday junction resolvase RusA-like endonuclease